VRLRTEGLAGLTRELGAIGMRAAA